MVATEGHSPYQETTEEQVCRKETRDELLSVLESCTEAQRRRFLLYALDGLSFEQIARLDGCSRVAVHYSIEAVRKKFKKFFKNHLNETPFSG
nr:sigma factor-like helix-turn-helix DNA-binding protein [Eisenbergiella sp. OF01-20]